MKSLVLVDIPAFIYVMRKIVLEKAKCIAILLILTGFFACDNTSVEPEEIELEGEITIEDANKLFVKLETSFMLSSTNDLKQFFTDWNEIVSPNTVKLITQNDTVEAVYEIYKLFYDPFDLTELGSWEWGNSLNSNCKYVAVQNKIIYGIVEDIPFEPPHSYYYLRPSHYDTINDFRPSLNFAKEQVLYLLPEYEEALNLFLRTIQFGTEPTESEDYWVEYAKDVQKRYEFIRPYIPILRGHWGWYWHIATHPHVYRIIFNKTLDKAKIDFRVGFQGGEATFEKSNNEWVVFESKVTWIE